MRRRKRRDVPAILKDCKELGKSIEIANAAYDALYRRLTSGTARIDGEHVKQSRGATDAMDALVIAGEERDALRARYAHAYTRAKELIGRLENGNYRDVLTNRYITGLTARQSAERLNYSRDYERELHRKALTAFEDVQKKEQGI